MAKPEQRAKRLAYIRRIISPMLRPRQGWEEAFRAAGSTAKDELLLEPLRPSRFDCEEWRW